MMMRSALFYTNTLGWIFSASSTRTPYSDYQPTSLCSFSLMLPA